MTHKESAFDYLATRCEDPVRKQIDSLASSDAMTIGCPSSAIEVCMCGQFCRTGISKSNQNNEGAIGCVHGEMTGVCL